MSNLSSTSAPTLAEYIATYIAEEQNQNFSGDIQNFMVDSYLIQNAIDAYNGGAR